MKMKEENDRLLAEKKKKKPVRYPTEDLDVVLGEKEKRAGMIVEVWGSWRGDGEERRRRRGVARVFIFLSLGVRRLHGR